MRRAALILLLWVWAVAAHAHKPSDSYLALSVEGNRIVGQWDIALRRKGEVAVARLVGMRGGSPDRQQQNQKEKPHRSARSAVSWQRFALFPFSSGTMDHGIGGVQGLSP